jgi:hypothetical protein
MSNVIAALNNYEAALRAELKKVVRNFQRFDHEQRANHAASHRLGHRQRERVGEYFYTHPSIPHVAFPTRKRAAMAAMET